MRRRLASLLSLVLIAALTGCGSSSGGSGSPLATELSYFPASSPFVLTLQTDPNAPAIKQAHQLESKFPLATLGQATISSRLQALGLNYDSDIRPLFAHPVAIGAPGPTFGTGSARSNFLIVWQTADADKLHALLKKIGIGNSVGTRDGATLYGAGSTSLAVAGSTLVFGPSPEIVTAALDRHARGGGIPSAQFSRETSGLNANSLVEIFGDLTGELSQPSAARARQIPWVGALRGYGVAVGASGSGLSMQFHLDTTGATLTSAQLPLAPGASGPALVNSTPIAVGIHDPAQIATFAQDAAQRIGGKGYFKFLGDLRTLRQRTGVDLNAFIRNLSGDAILGSDTHATLFRAALNDPASATRDLAKLAAHPDGLQLKPGEAFRSAGGGFYAIVQPSHTTYIGVAGNQLVIGNRSPAVLRRFASAPTTPAPGAQGTMAFRVALPQLLQLAIHGNVPGVARQILDQLGDITGWASSSSSGVTGSASLALK